MSARALAVTVLALVVSGCSSELVVLEREHANDATQASQISCAGLDIYHVCDVDFGSRGATAFAADVKALTKQAYELQNDLQRACISLATSLGQAAPSDLIISDDGVTAACEAARTGIAALKASTSIHLATDPASCTVHAAALPACGSPLSATSWQTCTMTLEAGDGRSTSASTPGLSAVLSMKGRIEVVASLASAVSAGAAASSSLPVDCSIGLGFEVSSSTDSLRNSVKAVARVADAL
jgi:hypothetical protein